MFTIWAIGFGISISAKYKYDILALDFDYNMRKKVCILFIKIFSFVI